MRNPISIKARTFISQLTGGHTKRMTFYKVSETLSKRFPYLNLKGLINVKSLKIIKKTSSFETTYHIEHTDVGVRSGRIMFINSASGYHCINIDPGLPRGYGIGATLFTLILLKDLGKKGSISRMISVRPNSISMTERMPYFSPVLVETKNKNGYVDVDIILEIPKLTQNEREAVKWFWDCGLIIE